MSISRNSGERTKVFFALSGAGADVHTIIILTLLAGGFSLISPTTVTATPSNSTSTTTPGIELSSQPVYQDHLRVVSENQINETHMGVTFSGNGTLTLPNTTQTINTTNNSSALILFMTLSVQGKETIRTQDGETATGTLYEIDRQPATTGESKGIVIAVVNTNATSGMLAPLNGKILAGIDDIQTTTSESRLTLWEWESGIGNNTGVASPPT
jgi:hypothetical protein